MAIRTQLLDREAFRQYQAAMKAADKHATLSVDDVPTLSTESSTMAAVLTSNAAYEKRRVAKAKVDSLFEELRSGKR